MKHKVEWSYGSDYYEGTLVGITIDGRYIVNTEHEDNTVNQQVYLDEDRLDFIDGNPFEGQIQHTSLDRPLFVQKCDRGWVGKDFGGNELTKPFDTKSNLVDNVGGERTTTVNKEEKIYQIIYEGVRYET